MAQPLYRDGYVYSIDKNLGLTCFELKTGRKLWDDDNQLTPKARNPHASIVWLNEGDRALALNSAGELVQCRLNPKRYDGQFGMKVLPGVGPSGARPTAYVREEGRCGGIPSGWSERVDL